MVRKVKPFWDNVERRGANECWPWVAGVDKDGYGKSNGKFYVSGMAHRAAYIMERGKIPPGILVCHSCDNPPCVNPVHLFLGTYRDNTQDAISKGRQFTPEQNAATALRVSKSLRGRPKTAAHNAAVSAAKRGTSLSDAHKASISATRFALAQGVARHFAFGV